MMLRALRARSSALRNIDPFLIDRLPTGGGPESAFRDILAARPPGGSKAGVFALVAHKSRVVVLDRSPQLHALNLDMIRELKKLLRAYEANEDVSAVVVRGGGLDDRAFCAGGDVVTLYKEGKDLIGQPKPADHVTKTFFREEYELNHFTSQMQAPYVALLNGITMGGGVGISVHGRYRLATENSLFAMPETAIGFFPDVGGTHFLPRLDGALGMYLGLTGHRLRGADLVHAGIATHMIRHIAQEELHRRLDELPGGSEAVTNVLHLLDVRNCSMSTFAPFSLLPHRAAIDRCFSASSLDDVFVRLQKETEAAEWANKTIATLERMSPISLRVTFRALKAGELKSLEACLQTEYRLAQRFMDHPDFFEGVRALLVDGDKKPRWKHASHKDVTEREVDAFFAPLPDASQELQLGHLHASYNPNVNRVPSLTPKPDDPLLEVAREFSRDGEVSLKGAAPRQARRAKQGAEQ